MSARQIESPVPEAAPGLRPRTARAFLAVVLSLAIAPLIGDEASALPADFEQSLFVGGLKDPATMAFAPDGRLFVGERIAGKVRIVTASGQLLPTPFLTLDVPPERHRSGGLRGFAFDPGFPASPHIYIFYTKQFADGKRHNRVSRFSLSGTDPDVADPGSELVLLELPFNSSATGSSGSHNGGAVVFGGDGKLYVTTGDGWQDSNGYFAGDNVQSLTTFTGKVLRIDKDGTIPADNPFYATTTGDFRAIYALGLRNPYAAATHPVNGEVYVFDVGTANGGGKDHIFKLAPGDNYGHDGDSGIGNRTGTWAKTGSGIVSGGAWYFADQFPATYRGRLFVTSWRQGLDTVTDTPPPAVADFGGGDVPNQGPLYPAVGPDGSLYYLDSTYETGDGRVYRIRYTAANTAAQPTLSPNGGSFVDSVTVALASITPGAVIRYTTDGSVPDGSSDLYTPPLTLDQSATLSARAFASGLDPSPAATATFTILPSSPPSFTSSPVTAGNVSSPYRYTASADATPAATFSLDASPAGMSINPSTGAVSWTPPAPGSFPVTVRAANAVAPDATQSFTVTVTNFRLADSPDPAELANGVQYAYFEGGATVATGAGNLLIPDLSPRSQDDGFEFAFNGFLEVPADGDYHFPIVADGNATLTIGSADTAPGPIGLQAGMHAITLRYTSSPSPPSLSLRWSGPGLAEQEIPAASYYRYTQPYGIFALRPAPAFLSFPPDETGPLPPRLSATGAFADLATLTPSPGLVPYSMNSPLYSDGAGKRRWIAVPDGSAITYDPTGEWAFPPGTVMVKHFELGDEQRRLETRFEIIRADGTPYFLTYQWRADQSEADLLPAAGASAAVEFDGGETQTWHFPGRADCLSCHNASVDHVLGPNTRQLNGEHLYPGSGLSDNQLRTWSHLGLFANPPDTASLPGLPSLSEVDAVSEPLEQRARSYLDANCAFCHNPAGSPEGTSFVLDYHTALEQSGLVGGAVADELGLGPLARVLAPQDPLHSVLLKRVGSNDPVVRMPPLGRDIVHAAARDTILEWLLTLPPANTSSDVGGWNRRWAFDGNIDSGTWRDAGNAPLFAAGQDGQALAFDGIHDAVDLGPLDVPGGALTIALWFKADDFGTGDARFLSKADGQNDQDHYWMLSTLDGTKLRLRLRAGGTTTTLISPAGTLAAGTWTHIAAVYDGASMALYKNAAEVASVAKTGVLDTSGTVDAAIGNQPATASGGARPFDGLIDDLRIYDRALTTAELATVRDAGTQTNTAPATSATPPANVVGTHITRAGLSQLSATASDAEDGPLAASWYSNRSGAFDPAAPGALPDGRHRIVATARDTDGSATSASFLLDVVPGFSGWASDAGLPGASPLDNPDDDALLLVEEYAHYLSPSEPEAGPITYSFIELAPGKHALAVSFPTRNDAIDLRYTVELSGDLVTWTTGATFTPTGTATTRTPNAGHSEPVAIDNSEPTSSITERDSVVLELPDTSRRFIRVTLDLETP